MPPAASGGLSTPVAGSPDSSSARSSAGRDAAWHAMTHATSAVKKERNGDVDDAAASSCVPPHSPPPPVLSPERLLMEQYERLKQQQGQVANAFSAVDEQLCECAGMLNQYRRVMQTRDTVGDTARTLAGPTGPGADVVVSSPELLGDLVRGAPIEELAERCALSAAKAIRGTEMLFRFLFERLYLHQLAANSDFVENMNRALEEDAVAATSAANLHANKTDTSKPDDTAVVSASSSFSSRAPLTTSTLRTEPVREALESLKQAPNAVLRFQADCQRLQVSSLASSEPLSSSVLTATRVFAVSAHYPSHEQAEIVSFLNNTLHVAALVLPNGVPEVELALWMRCCFLVSPVTTMTTPILSMPNERMQLVYHRSRQDPSASRTHPTPREDGEGQAQEIARGSSSMAAVGGVDGVPAMTRAADVHRPDEVRASAEEEEEQCRREEEERAAVANADAELLELLHLLDTQQQQRHAAPEAARAATPASFLSRVPSPCSEHSLPFPPKSGTPYPEEPTGEEAHAMSLAREDSLSNTTALSQASLTQGTGASQDALRRARHTSATPFTRHRRYSAAGATDDGLGRMSTSTQPSIFFSQARKRARPEATAQYPSTQVDANQRVPGSSLVRESGAGSGGETAVSSRATSTRSHACQAAVSKRPRVEDDEEEPVVVATQNTVVESQLVLYNHGVRQPDYNPLGEAREDWIGARDGAEVDGLQTSSQGQGPRARSDSSSRSHPYAGPARTSGEDESSIGFESVHNPLETAAPLMLPGTAAAMQMPSREWLFQISNSVRDERPALVDAIRQLGGEVDLASAFNPRTTHLVTAEGLTERTEKYLSACAAGILIVPPRCVMDSMQRGHWVRGQKMLQYNMNPCRRFLAYPPAYNSLPFAQWRVLLLSSHASVAKGIRTVLRAGGCTHVSVLVFDAQSDAPCPQEANVAAAVAASANTVLSHTSAEEIDESGDKGIDGSVSSPPLPPVELTGLQPLSAIDPMLVRRSTHILVECADMSSRTPGTFRLPPWFPVCLIRRDVYGRLFTLEILYHNLCSSLEPIFDAKTGELLAENAVIPACRVEPFE